MAALSEISTLVYPDAPSVINVPMMQKIREIMQEEELNKLRVRYRFGQIDKAVLRVVGQFRRELTPNEVHSYASLLQHKESEATEVQIQPKVKDVRARVYYPDPLILFDNLSTNVDVGRDTMWYLHRCEGFAELVLEMQGVELAHRYVKLFRAYHMAVAARVTQLLEYGLTQDAQYRLRCEMTAHLSSTIPFEAVYRQCSLANAGKR